MTNALAEICAKKHDHIARQKKLHSEKSLMEKIHYVPAPRGFKSALEKKIQAGKFALIAEIKKASPSKGIIREDFSPKMLAYAYEHGGAASLSVLTDEPYFQGKDHYLLEAHAASHLPILRKDFMLDPYQIIESRALGADCILLIMAALSDTQANELEMLATQLGMDVLVEVHDEVELRRALQINPNNPHKMLGVNNRNLKTLEVELAVSEILANQIPKHILRVCESGITSHDDLRRMKRSGFMGFLVGESLMRENNVLAATRTLLGE